MAVTTAMAAMRVRVKDGVFILRGPYWFGDISFPALSRCRQCHRIPKHPAPCNYGLFSVRKLYGEVVRLASS